jgi:hypothetical protein
MENARRERKETHFKNNVRSKKRAGAHTKKNGRVGRCKILKEEENMENEKHAKRVVTSSFVVCCDQQC